MPLPPLRSPAARAIAPVAAGILAIAALAGLLWLIAIYLTNSQTSASERFAPSEFEVGPVDGLAETVSTTGPMLFTGLNTSIGSRSIVVNHTGDDPADGWRVYWAYPADRTPECPVSQQPNSATFIDCDGRPIAVDELSPPDRGVVPRVDDRTTLVIDFRAADPVNNPGSG